MGFLQFIAQVIQDHSSQDINFLMKKFPYIEIYIFELHRSIIYLKSAIWAWFYIHWVVFLFQGNNEIPGILFSTDSIKPANHIQQKTITMKQSTSCAVYSFPKGFCNQASEFLFDFQIDMRENGCNFKKQIQKVWNFNNRCALSWTYVLWFQFILGLMFFELVSILFAIVPDYGNEYKRK